MQRFILDVPVERLEDLARIINKKRLDFAIASTYDDEVDLCIEPRRRKTL